MSHSLSIVGVHRRWGEPDGAAGGYGRGRARDPWPDHDAGERA